MLQYHTLAELFAYPAAGFAQAVGEAQQMLDRQYPDAGAEMKPFTEFVAGAAPTELEEVFTRTFEVQAITTLDIGYVLFGDDYKRGALLVNLNREHREAGIDCGNELADHLPNLLRLLAKMDKPELRAELVQKIVAPALRKIISEFSPEKIAQKNAVYQKHHKTLIERPAHYGTVYQFPLKALYRVLESDFDVQEIPAPPQSADFLKSIGNEMNIES